MTHTKWILPVAVLLLAFGTGCSKVPDLSGMTQSQAQDELTKQKLTMGAVTYANVPGKTAGTVVDQDPKPKESIPSNKTIALVLQAGANSGANSGGTGTNGGTSTTGGNTTQGNTSGGQASGMVQVPNLVGQTQDTAQAMLNQLGLVPGQVTVVLNDKPPGQVFFQDPPANTSVTLGTLVNLTVASDQMVTVPSVLGQPQASAEQLIKNAQLIPESESDIHPGGDPVGNVFDQNPAAGLKILKGQPVTLRIKQDAATVPHVVGYMLQQAQLALYQANLTPVVHYVRDPANVGKVTSQTVPDNTPLAKGAPVGINVGELDFRLIGRYIVMARPQATTTQNVQIKNMMTQFKRQ